jgi:hypothetical protein
MMIKRRLASISALDPIEVTLGAIEEGLGAANEASNQLRAPTVNERAALYLRAVNEKRDFTTEEHSRARDLILDAMAAEIIAKSKVSLPEALTLSKQVSGADLQELASRKIVSLAAATPPSADATSSPSQIVPFSRPSRRGATRNSIFAAAAIAAVAACFLIIAIPTYTTNPNSFESKVVVQPSPPNEMIALFPAAPKQVETMAAPRVQMERLTGDDDTLIKKVQSANQIGTGGRAELLKRGRELIVARDIPAARSVLKQAAEAGDASAALELGATYDPISLKEYSGVTITPDIAEARAWYLTARELGSAEASKRLERLSGTVR